MRTKNFDHFIQITAMPLAFPINCYLVIENDSVTLIDAGNNSLHSKLVSIIKNQPFPLMNIVFTHNHSDHIGDIRKLRNEFPDATFHMSPTDSQSLEDIDVSPLTEGQTIGSLKVVDTPGHTEGSISLVDIRTQTAFVGDLVQSRGGIAICGDLKLLFPFPGMATWNPKVSCNSFEHLETYSPKLLCVGHGDPILYSNPKLQESLKRLQKTQ